MTDQLSSFRRTFDERLTALHAGLADPDSSTALESLVLDLVRAAVDEADAAANDAVAQAQRRADAMLANALTEADAAHVQLDGERAQSAALRAEVVTLKEQLNAAVIARQDADAAHRRDRADLAASVAGLQRTADEAKRAADEARRAAKTAADELAAASARAAAAGRERDALAHDLRIRATEREALVAERDALSVERTALIASRDNLAAERDALSVERTALIASRDGLAAERRALVAERDALTAEQADRADSTVAVAERDALVIERNALMLERDALMTAREALTEERDRLLGDRADFLRAHDAMTLQRDTLAHERDDIMRDRDRQIAQLHADLDTREKMLKETREKAAAAAAQKKAGAAAPAAPATGPERKSDRKAFTNALGVQIDGEAALLVDLSLTGAQVLSCAALKPAKTVKMLLPSSDAPVLCRGRIVWARLEPTTPGKPIRYRAGMFFTATDQAAVQTFIARHGSRSAHA